MVNIFKALGLIGCLVGVITTSSQVTVIPIHIDTVVVLDTILDSSPIVELMPFKINADINNETIKDLKDVLKGYEDGRLITIKKEPLADRTGQAFYISAKDSNVILKYTTKQSLENAVYTYLDILGIRWYGAGENWLYKPKVLNHINIAGQWIEPTFRNRNFDGTGGLDIESIIDPNFLYKKNWYTFKRRNRFNGDFEPPSHVGQAFYINNVALCDAHPEWFNSQAGKVSGRIRVEIPEAVQAYKDWYARTPNLRDSFITINVDPEDGRGGTDDPLPPDGFNGIAKWNHADKWWYFANEIAKVYDSNSTRIHIGALSYGDGATNTLTPKFPLKKNVYPMVTPYAFQTAYLPKQMVRKWNANTAGNMGIYDYWNITQWSLGLPQLNIYTIPKKLSFWRQNTIDGIQLETTDAGGPMGHVFWLAGQLQFDTTKDFNTLYHKYLVDCFGKGWQPMKRMFDRWSLNYQDNSDVSFTLKDLKEASDLVALNSIEWKRINDLKAYAHFMRLMAQRTYSQANNDSIYHYIYSIHHRMMVQTAAFVGEKYLGKAPAPLTAHQLTNAEVETNFLVDIKSLPVEYGISNMVFDYDKATYVDSMPITAWKYGLFASGQFKAKFTGTVSIDMGTQERQTKAKIFTEDSVYVNEMIMASNSTFNEVINGEVWNMKNYVINVVKGQTFNVSAFGGYGRVRVRTPEVIVFVRNSADDFDNYAYPIKYFYVPIGTKKIAYKDQEAQPANGRGYLIPPGGTGLKRTLTSAKDIYTVDVPQGKDGQVWSASFGHASWSLKNIPNISALQRFSYNELQ